MSSQYEPLHARGIAIGWDDIKNDTMTFKFRDEEFTFPTRKVFPITRYNGYFYEANIDDLRKLEAEAVSP